jgi:hypothetical protein
LALLVFPSSEQGILDSAELEEAISINWPFLQIYFFPVSVNSSIWPSSSGEQDKSSNSLVELLFVPADVPELLDVTEELLLESVEELDFVEEELFVDEDETLSLLPLSEDSFSGLTKLLLSSSPQAVKDIVMANSAKARNLQIFN